ncbi:hypothetical protein N665_0076s0346 [Sinapis alba]|nr:hypothetical protein N665_0076s0346 [Sinapis alba]
MEPESSDALSPRQRQGVLRDQVQDSERYKIDPIENPLPLEEGFYAVIHASQLLAEKNDGLILVGLAGPSGAGKSFFTEKLLNFLPSAAIINMNSYNDGTRLNDGDFDDQRLTDYDTLLDNIHDLKEGKSVQVPIYDFKSSSRIGYRTLEVPSNRIVILEGIYALSEKLRPFLDLRVSVTGGVHFDLVKRVFRDIQRAGQPPEDIFYQIFETVYPKYTALIEPDLLTAHIRITNKFDPFTGFQNPTFSLKSTKDVTPEQMKAVLSEDFKERIEETHDIYLLPPGEDPGECQSYLRMRNRDGKYSLMFQEWVTVRPFVISPRITLEVNVRLLGGLMTLGYTVATILKRKSHIFDDDKVIVKTDCFEQPNRTYVQVQGRDRTSVENVADQLGLEDSSYVPHTYIEQMQLVNNVTAFLDDLEAKLSLIPSHGGGVSKSYTNQRPYVTRAPASVVRLPYQGVMTQLLEQISTLNARMDDFTSRIEEVNSNIPNRIAAAASGSLPSSSSQLRRESPQIEEEVALVAGRQRQIMLQVDKLSNLLHQYVGETSRTERDSNSTTQNLAPSTVPVLLAFAIGCIGILAYSLK